MMQFTSNIDVLKHQLVAHAPILNENDDNTESGFVFLYLQDVTCSVDYYVLGYFPECGTILAVIDPYRDSSFCLIEEEALSSLRDHHIFYKIYKRSKRPHYSQVQERIRELYKTIE